MITAEETKNEVQRSVICILGMHRSGTSCLTGSLQNHGLYLGDVIDFAPHNLKGNKENKKLWAINDLALFQSNGSWDTPPKALTWNDTVRTLRDSFIEGYSDKELWGFKDPRCVLTLPLWLEAIPNLKMCGTFRHPYAVAHSLAKRNGFSLNDSLALWEHYNKALLNISKKHRIPMVCFDSKPHEYKAAIVNVAKHLGLSTSPTNPLFFDDTLRTEVNFQIEIKELPKNLKEIYSKLTELTLTN